MHRASILASATIAFAILVGLHLSAESLVLIAGIAIGFLVSLPAHLAVYRLAVHSRQAGSQPAPPPAPVEVVGPLPAARLLPRSPRRFITIGNDDPDDAYREL